jgi:hypothetical protein
VKSDTFSICIYIIRQRPIDTKSGLNILLDVDQVKKANNDEQDRAFHGPFIRKKIASDFSRKRIRELKKTMRSPYIA